VTLERLTPEIGTPRLRGGKVTVDVRCASACRPVVKAGRAKKTFRVTPGAKQRLTLRAPSVRRVTVTVGETRRSFSVNRSARSARQSN
jgi:hypothetical protein